MKLCTGVSLYLKLISIVQSIESGDIYSASQMTGPLS